MKVLVINAGSSSVKYQLFDMDKKDVMAKGICDRIGIDGKITHQAGDSPKKSQEVSMPTHAAAIKILIEKLVSKDEGCISSVSEIDAVGHRVVHGGEHFSGSVVIDKDVIKAIEECIELAPLHNPPNITGINACYEIMGDIPQVGVFDTAFHQSMPKRAYMYALPYEYYEKFKIRKYGFHGTSHKYVAERAAALLGKPIAETKIITCHLGNGSSITAVMGGKSVDTSMGFTPLDGVAMGTRCGSIDPAIVTFLMERENLSAREITDIMNKKSGLLGLSGVSSDMRDIDDAADAGDARAKLTIDILSYQVKKLIGSYAAAMGGLDAVVFTAGIGENNMRIVFNSTEGLEFMGIKTDREKGKKRGGEIDISGDGASVRTFVIPTNEELAIALETKKLLLG